MKNKIKRSLFYIVAIAIMPLLLISCASKSAMKEAAKQKRDWIVPHFVQQSYQAVEHEDYYIPAVDLKQIEPQYWRQNVYYPTEHEEGTIVIDTDRRFLYYILGNNGAIRYGIGVGKEGLAFKGKAVIGHKKAWPAWRPTANMMARDPERYGHLRDGMAPGSENPLGARALYLYRGGKDSLFRIHGSHEAWSIGKAVSSGCIRMLNQDAIDLYERVALGTKVEVL